MSREDMYDRQEIESIHSGENGWPSEDEADQIVAAAAIATEPMDRPFDPVYALMSKFTEDLFLLSAKMKALGRPE